jgi:polyisoprenyl-teichoic acid--peptidoglycan teichoic acid transferase
VSKHLTEPQPGAECLPERSPDNSSANPSINSSESPLKKIQERSLESPQILLPDLPEPPLAVVSANEPKNLPQQSPKKRHLSLGKFVFTLAMTLSCSAGVMLARVAPITAFDWAALLRGQDSKEIFLEGLSRKLTKPYQILVIGVDKVPGAAPDSPEAFNGRSDTMLLVGFDPGANQPASKTLDQKRGINLLSIPRDTQITLPQYGVVKINAANVYGGAPLAQEAVKEALDGVKIDRYVRVDTAGLIALVDALGGVEVDVPKPMRYVDKTQKLDIDLQPGRQVLNGIQAEGFARFRHDEEGDIGRIKRQQVLLKGIKAKFTDPILLLKLPDLIALMRQHVDTNLNLEEMLAIAAFGATVKPEQVKTLTLPGRPSEDYEFETSYWLTDPAQITKTIKGKFQVDQPAP